MSKMSPEVVVQGILSHARQATSIVALVGAGLSRNAVPPDVRAMLGTIASRAKHGEVSAERAQITVANAIQEFQLGPGLAHFALAELQPSVIVTTNYDDLIEKALELSGRTPIIVTPQVEAIPSDRPPNAVLVYKIHGSLDATSSLSIPDFLYYRRGWADEPVIRHLRSILSVSLVIVMGFGLYRREEDGGELGSMYELLGGGVGHSSWVILADGVDRINESLWRNRGVAVFDTPYQSLPSVLRGLRTRDKSTRPAVREQRRVLVVSSAGNINLEQGVGRILSRSGLEPVFLRDTQGLGGTRLENLEALSVSSSAAAVIIGDLASGAKIENENLMFELGLLLGRLGRNRVIVMVPAGQQPPVDVGGMRYIIVDANTPSELEIRLRRWAEAIQTELS